MFKIISTVIFIIVLVTSETNLEASPDQLPVFSIYTENWYPYQYMHNDKMIGISVDLLEMVLIKAGSDQTRKDFQMVPWARGMHHLKINKSTILFLTTRTKERDSQFKWVGPVFKNKTCLIAKKSRKVVFKNSEDLKKYKTATIIGDVSKDYILSKGLPEDNLTYVADPKLTLKMIENDRIDFIVDNESNFISVAKGLGIDYNKYEIIEIVNIDNVSYAFSIDTPDWVIKRFQKILNNLKRQGNLKRLYEKYGVPPKSILTKHSY